MPNTIGRMMVLASLCCFAMYGQARAQQVTAPEDPEDDKKLGLWLDQGFSIGLTSNKSLEIEVHERYDEVISNFYEYFCRAALHFECDRGSRLRLCIDISASREIPRWLTKTVYC
jgi:hypothetical protein